ncbi:MAG TPA: branched-chain amino acid ABC transporter permease [Candidatus Sulfotelmatobacter sp.]|nr:branched-chain amino acid ABC transporter permease [Candidatus Sulfotelmatobacter sp.]
MLSDYHQTLLLLTGINVLLGWGAYLPLATGQLSLGNAGFMAVGAYAASLLTVQRGWSLTPALLAGALLAGALGVLLGFPALRLRGIYLAIATLGFGEIVRTFFLNFERTGGPMGMRGMSGTTLGMVWLWVLGCGLLLFALAHARLGLSLDAVQEDEVAAELIGLNVTALKVGAFGVGAALAGLGGGLFAHHILFIEPGTFNFLESITMVLFVLLGGMRTFWGTMVGAAVFTILPDLLRFLQDWRGAFFGALLVALLIVRPFGLLPRETLRIPPRRLAGGGG